MNDRPDLAVKLTATAWHVGQDDMPYAEARRIVGPERQIGVTCKAPRSGHDGGRSRRRLRGVRARSSVQQPRPLHGPLRSRSSNGGRTVLRSPDK